MIKSNTTACGAPRDLFRVPPSNRLARIPFSLCSQFLSRQCSRRFSFHRKWPVTQLGYFFRFFFSLVVRCLWFVCAQVSAFIIIAMRICGPDLFSAASVFEF
jgi:hypothetical protein